MPGYEEALESFLKGEQLLKAYLNVPGEAGVYLELRDDGTYKVHLFEPYACLPNLPVPGLIVVVRAAREPTHQTALQGSDAAKAVTIESLRAVLRDQLRKRLGTRENEESSHGSKSRPV